jgi:hypothetical protein
MSKIKNISELESLVKSSTLQFSFEDKQGKTHNVCIDFAGNIKGMEDFTPIIYKKNGLKCLYDSFRSVFLIRKTRKDIVFANFSDEFVMNHLKDQYATGDEEVIGGKAYDTKRIGTKRVIFSLNKEIQE